MTMTTPLTARQAAEAIEQFGDDLAKLCRDLDRLCGRMSPSAIDEISGVPNQDHLDTVAEAFSALGDRLCRECDAAEEAEDRRQMISIGGHRDGGSAA